MKNKVRLDDKDWQLLELLQENARTSFIQLARRVSLSAPAATERVRRVEEAGVIRGYRADVDTEKLGFPITAIIRIEVPSGSGCATLLKSLEKVPEVLGAFRVTGTASAIVEAFAASPTHLEDLLNRLGPLGKTSTAIATSRFRRVPAISRPGGGTPRRR